MGFERKQERNMFNDESIHNSNNSNRLLMGAMLLLLSVASFLAGQNSALGEMSLTRTGANCVLMGDGPEYMEERGCTEGQIACLSDCYTKGGLINSPGVFCHKKCGIMERSGCWAAFDYAVRVNPCI